MIIGSLFGAESLCAQGNQLDSKTTSLYYRIGILACPSKSDVEWNEQNLNRLKKLGFNAMQLNLAWGCRPADEPLNLEDVVYDEEISKSYSFKGLHPFRADNSPARKQQRQDELRKRIALCKKTGMRTIFHFGAPNNVCYSFGSADIDSKMPLCLLEPNTVQYYVKMLNAFAKMYPGVDDILVYTYDQDAWLCNEFGTCPACQGIPLHERVVPFVNKLARAWKQCNPSGRFWWEPWELSAGQVYRCIEQLDPNCVGLMLHSNVAEVQVTMAVDRWLKNSCCLAKTRAIPVVVECFLGAPSEEVEPFNYLAYPQVVFRQIKAIYALDGVIGIKEYYGTIPDKEDANLRVAGAFFNNPTITESKAIDEIAQDYGPAGEHVKQFWEKTSQAMELFPWDTSWYIRQVGRCDPVHSMTAAFIRGQQTHTPSWASTRSAIFMKTDNAQPDHWMLEDVQLRCELAAQRLAEALIIGKAIQSKVPESLREDFQKGLDEWGEFRRRTLSYVYHLRETNLVAMMRRLRQAKEPIPDRLMQELKEVLLADQVNQKQKEPIQTALNVLDKDVDAFLSDYFLVTDDQISKGHFTLTSR